MKRKGKEKRSQRLGRKEEEGNLESKTRNDEKKTGKQRNELIRRGN